MRVCEHLYAHKYTHFIYVAYILTKHKYEQINTKLKIQSEDYTHTRNGRISGIENEQILNSRRLRHHLTRLAWIASGIETVTSHTTTLHNNTSQLCSFYAVVIHLDLKKKS